MNDRANFVEPAPRWRAPPADPVLPALPLALDAGAMAGVLDRLTVDGRVVDCRIERVKYRPRRNAVVLYRAAIESAGERRRECFLHACLYAPDEARRRFAATGKRAPGSKFAAAVTLVEERAMLVWAFPHDRKLAALAVLDDPARLAGELLPAIIGGRVDACRVTPISYFPEHAYTVRVDVTTTAGAARLYAKTDADGRGAATAAAMRALRAGAAHHDGRLRIARPRACQPELATLWQDELPGRVLEAVAGPGIVPAPLAFAVGEALAALHASPVDRLQTLTSTALLARTLEAARTIAASLPGVAAPLLRVSHRLALSVPDDSEAGRATLHGDLHLNNIVVGESGNGNGSGIGFIDLDDLVAGPAAAELGAFVAGLIYRQALRGGAAGSADAAIAAFLDGYAAAAGGRPATRIIRWHAAAALLRERAWRCLTALKPGRIELIPALVGSAETLLCSPASDARVARLH